MIDCAADCKAFGARRIGIEFVETGFVPVAVSLVTEERDSGEHLLGVQLTVLRRLSRTKIGAQTNGLFAQHRVAIRLRIAIGGEPVPIAEIMKDAGLMEAARYRRRLAE